MLRFLKRLLGLTESEKDEYIRLLGELVDRQAARIVFLTEERHKLLEAIKWAEECLARQQELGGS